jgi:ABC-type bacteriocin/lantibiotic exporter with double-glycine peptidase domain
LFEGSVLENITMWDSSISYEDAVSAAKAACIHEDIISRSGGYRETVTENGKNFSGGQRQRIEIARAIAKKPSVIIMDEATSALDTDTEEQVMRNIKSLGITTIVVAHRLSTIMDSDEIIVMDNGSIAERGTHDELMKKRGKYYSLVRS